jgi:hypothetical protein
MFWCLYNYLVLVHGLISRVLVNTNEHVGFTVLTNEIEYEL